MSYYDEIWKYIQAPADFMRDDNREGINSQQSHQSQVIRWNLVNVVAIVFKFIERYLN